MNGGKKLGVIILNWNGLDLLKKFLPVASSFTRGDEVELVVADNGSEDGSVQWIEQQHPEVRIIRMDKNYGFAEGYNRAIEQTKYEYTVLLNSDVEVTPGWWQPLLEFMESHPEAGAVQPKIKSYHNRNMFEYAGAAGGFLDSLAYPYCRGRIMDSIEKDEGQYDKGAIEIAWASGACLMVRTADYLAAGGLDPLFFAHMEEIDLCCRLWGLGRRIYCVPYSEIYHVGGASLNSGNPKKTYLNFRNNLLLIYKNMPRQIGRKKLFRRRLADILPFLMFIAKFDFPNAGAILKAHKDFKKMKRSYDSFPDKNILSSLPGADFSLLKYKLRLSKNNPFQK